MKDVALLAVDVVQKGDAGAAVRDVLDGSDLRGHAVLLALEVDDAVAALVAAALVPRRDAAVVVAARLVRQRRKQGLLRLVRRDLGEVRDRLETSARARRLVLFDSCLLYTSRFALAIIDFLAMQFLLSYPRPALARGCKYHRGIKQPTCP